MKIFLQWLIVSWLVLFPALLLAADAPPFAQGEKLYYIVKWGIVTAGYATLNVSSETVNSQSVYHIVSEARTTSFMDAFYKVRDRNESVVSQEPFQSLSFYKDLNEGKYHSKETVIFKQEEGKVIYDDATMDMVKGSIDVLAALYYVRMQNLDENKEFTVPSCNNKKNFELIVKVKSRKQVEVPAGKFETTLVEPLLKEEGIFMHSGRLFVYMSNDTRKIPVLLRSKIAVGSISAELIKVEPAVGEVK
jgi:hypothetical protein